MIPGPVGMAAAAVSVVAYAVAGDKKRALMAAAGIALAAVGAGVAAVAAVKAARVASQAGRLEHEAIVVGETMTRVRTAASDLRAATYEPANFRLPDKGIAKALNHIDNYRWLRSQMKAKTTIYDIGRDLSRAKKSSYYTLERAVLKAFRYKNLVRVKGY